MSSSAAAATAALPSQAAKDAADAQRALQSVLLTRALAAAKQQRRLDYAAQAAAANSRRRKHSSEEDEDEPSDHDDANSESAVAAAAPASRAHRSKAARTTLTRDESNHAAKIDPLALIRQTKQAQDAAAAEAVHRVSAIAAASSRDATALPATASSSAAAASSNDAVWPLELTHAAVRSEIDDVDWEAEGDPPASARPSLLHQSSLSTQQATQPLDDMDLDLGDSTAAAAAAAADPDGVDRAAWDGQNEEVLFGEEDDAADAEGADGDSAARIQSQQLAQIDAEERAARAAAAEAAARKAAADDPMLLNKIVLKSSASAPAASAASNGAPLEISFETQSAEQLEQQAKDLNSAKRLQKATTKAAAASASSAAAAASAKRARSSSEVDMDGLFGAMSDEDAAEDDDAAAVDSPHRKGSASKRKAKSSTPAKKKALPIPPSQRMTKDNKELVLAVHRVHVLSMMFLWRQYSSPLTDQSVMGDETLIATLLSIALNKVPHLRSKGFTLDPRKPAVWVGAKKRGSSAAASPAAAAGGSANQGLKWKTSHGAGASPAAAAAASSSSSAAAAAASSRSSPDEVPPASEGTVFDRVQKLAYWFRSYFRCHGDRIRLPLSDKKHPLHAVDPRLHSKMHNMLRCTCIRQRIIHTGVTRGTVPNRWAHYKSCIVSQLHTVLSTREGGFEHLTMLFCMLLRQSHVLARMCYGFTSVNYREGIVFPTKTAAQERHAGTEMLGAIFEMFGAGAQFGSEGGGGFAQMLRAQSLPSQASSSSSSAAASSFFVLARPSSSGVPPSPQALHVLNSAKQEKCPCKSPFKPVVYTSIDEMIAEEKATRGASASPAPAAAAAAAASSSSSAAAAAAASPSKPSPHFSAPASPAQQQQQQRKKESFLSAAAAGAIEILDDSDDDLMEVTMTKASPQSKSPAAVRGALGALASEAGSAPAAAAAASSSAASPIKSASTPPSAAAAALSASPVAPVVAVSASPPSFRAAKSKPVNYTEAGEDDDEDEEMEASDAEEEEEEAASKLKRRASFGKAKAKAAGSGKGKGKRAASKAASAADDSGEIEDVTPATSRKKKAAGAAPARKSRKKAGSAAAAAAASSPEAVADVDLTLPESPPLRGLAGVGVLAKAKPRRSRSTQAAEDASFDAATAEAARAAAADFEIDSDLDRPAAAAASGFSSITAASVASSKRAQKQYFEHGYPLVWIEFYSPEERRWIHLDLLRELFDSPFVYEHDGGLSLEYVIAVRPSIEGRQPLLSDVTKRYTNQWHKIQSQRLDESWFTAELARLSGPCAPLDRDLENSDAADLAALHSASESIMPTSLSAFKSHPQWCLEMHCGKFEAIYPKGAEHSRGVFVEKRRAAKGEEQPAVREVHHLIYPRSSLHTLHTIDRWRREQRAVKDSEVPYPVKSVKRNAHMSKEAAARKAALGLIPPGGERSELYGIWQTEAWMPAAAAGDGLVPKNARGHVDVWGASHVPGGCVHLKLPDHEGSFGSLSRAARKLGVDYAKAMVGFDVARHGSVPRFEGIVVLAEHADAVKSMALEMEVAAVDRAEKKRMAKINDGWRRLVKGNIVRMRLMQQMGEDGQAMMPVPAGGSAAAGAAAGVGAAAKLSNTAYGAIAIAGRAAAAAGGSSAASGVVVPDADHVHSFDAKTFDPDQNEWSAMCRCGARQTFEEI